MKITGIIKVLSFKEERVAIKLGDAQFFKDGKWDKQYGDVWVSSFDKGVLEACKMLEKGNEIQSMVTANKNKAGREFLNIVNIGLKMPEKDINDDMPTEETGVPDDAPMFQEGEEPAGLTHPDYIRPEPSTTIDMPGKELLIIRQTCIKAAGNALMKMEGSTIARSNLVVEIARRLEKYVLEGK